jgi:hypothetical protein
MKFKTLTAIALVAAVVISSPSHAASSLFEQGLQDRGQWEQWFNSLQSDYKTGAFFWASQRSLPNPGSCKQMNDQFYAGCTEAKVKLSTSDALRKTEPDYKTGWNAWDPSYVTAPAAPAFVVAPAPAPAPAPRLEVVAAPTAYAEMSSQQAINYCVNAVRQQSPPYSRFDAFITIDQKIQYFGNKHEDFVFEKCMTQVGHGLVNTHSTD